MLCTTVSFFKNKLLTGGSHEVDGRILVQFGWNYSAGVRQQLFNLVSYRWQVSGDGLQTRVDPGGRAERLYGPGGPSPAPGGS